MTSFEPSGQADQVKSTGRFVKMSVSPRRNDQFAAGPESRSAILNDSTAVLSGLQVNGSQRNQIKASRQVFNLLINGSVLLNQSINQSTLCPSPY